MVGEFLPALYKGALFLSEITMLVARNGNEFSNEFERLWQSHVQIKVYFLHIVIPSQRSKCHIADGQGSYDLDIHICGACMSPSLNGSSAVRLFKCDDAIEKGGDCVHTS